MYPLWTVLMENIVIFQNFRGIVKGIEVKPADPDDIAKFENINKESFLILTLFIMEHAISFDRVSSLCDSEKTETMRNNKSVACKQICNKEKRKLLEKCEARRKSTWNKSRADNM